jgi:hypothetical protein
MNRRKFVSMAGGLVFAETVSRLNAAENTRPGPILVEAGRRVDASDATIARFPAQNVPAVRAKIERELRVQKPISIVCSAACGADLLLLDVTEEMHIQRYILLPSKPDEFRSSSVTDRPGDWGELYNRALSTSTVKVLNLPQGQEGYLETNLKLLHQAQELANQKRTSVKALVIWDNKSRGPDDVTAHFLEQARLRKMPILEIYTL